MGNARILLIATLLAGCSADSVDKTPDSGHVDMEDAPADLAGTDVEQTVGAFIVEPSMLVIPVGGAGPASLSLTAEPATDLVVTLVSSDPDTVLTSGTLTFTRDNWETPQSALLQGVATTCSPDGTMVTISGLGAENYVNASASLQVHVENSEQPRLSVWPPTQTLREGDEPKAYTATLDEDCIDGAVTILVSSSDESEFTVDVDKLVFTAESTSREFLLQAVDDVVLDDSGTHTLILGPVSGGRLDGFDPEDLEVQVSNDDEEPVAHITPTLLTTTEAGTTATFTVTMMPRPTYPVQITPVVGDPTEGSVAPTLLMFGPELPSAQTVTVTGLADGMLDGAQTYQITFETVPHDVDQTDVAVTNLDVDSIGVAVLPPSLSILEGQSDTFSVALSGDPGEVITIDLVPSTSDVMVNPTTITIDSTNFGTPMPVTVTANDNAVTDGTRMVTIQTTLNATGLYSGQDPDDVVVQVIDDD